MSNIKFKSEFSEEELLRYKKLAGKLPKRYSGFNGYGLRYPVDDLNKIDKRVIFFPLEEMAEFVDVVSKGQVDTQDKNYNSDILSSTIGSIKTGYGNINATSIGNLAYAYLHFKDEMVKKHILSLLEYIFEVEQVKRN